MTGISTQTRLPNKEIKKINRTINRVYAPVKPVSYILSDHQQKLSSQKLKEISDNIRRYYAPTIPLETNQIKLMSINPGQIYVHWHFNQFQLENRIRNQPATVLHLKVTATDLTSEKEDQITLYQSSISHPQASQTIQIPKGIPHSQLEASLEIYSAETETDQETIVKSNPTIIPLVNQLEHDVTTFSDLKSKQDNALETSAQLMYPDTDSARPQFKPSSDGSIHFSASYDSGYGKSDRK